MQVSQLPTYIRAAARNEFPTTRESHIMGNPFDITPSAPVAGPNPEHVLTITIDVVTLVHPLNGVVGVNDAPQVPGFEDQVGALEDALASRGDGHVCPGGVAIITSLEFMRSSRTMMPSLPRFAAFLKLRMHDGQQALPRFLR